jgi:hypothetical protein
MEAQSRLFLQSRPTLASITRTTRSPVGYTNSQTVAFHQFLIVLNMDRTGGNVRLEAEKAVGSDFPRRRRCASCRSSMTSSNWSWIGRRLGRGISSRSILPWTTRVDIGRKGKFAPDHPRQEALSNGAQALRQWHTPQFSVPSHSTRRCTLYDGTSVHLCLVRRAQRRRFQRGIPNFKMAGPKTVLKTCGVRQPPPRI